MMVQRCYIYLGTRGTASQWKHKRCYAVLNQQGKCIRGRNGTMLVEFPGRGIVNVIARRLRKTNR